MTCPCGGCPERYPACHDKCAKFFSWKSWEKLRKTKPDDGGADDMLIANSAKRHDRFIKMNVMKTKG